MRRVEDAAFMNYGLGSRIGSSFRLPGTEDFCYDLAQDHIEDYVKIDSPGRLHRHAALCSRLPARLWTV